MRPGEAVMELTRQGFRFRLDGEAIKVRFEGEQTPDLAVVSPLLDLVRHHKDDVRYFLKSYCPRCGGCCFVPDFKGRPLCLACDWGELVDLYPGLKLKH
jgi:ribosomal protein S27AE